MNRRTRSRIRTLWPPGPLGFAGLSWSVLVLLSAGSGCTEELEPCVDFDLDGYSVTYEDCNHPIQWGSDYEEDCEDFDAAVHPGADEYPDGRDNDCDGLVDEGTSISDDDSDGYSEQEGDCDDTDSAIYPGAEDLPDDDIDSNCDGYDHGSRDDLVDPGEEQEGDSASADALYFGDTGVYTSMLQSTWVGDLDGDGLDDLAFAQTSVVDELQRSEVKVIYGEAEHASGQFAYDEVVDWTLEGVDTPNLLGTSITSGDLNGDGLSDLVVGDPYHFHAYIFWGTTSESSSRQEISMATGTRTWPWASPWILALD